jgi:hypothetical protein
LEHFGQEVVESVLEADGITLDANRGDLRDSGGRADVFVSGEGT